MVFRALCIGRHGVFEGFKYGEVGKLKSWRGISARNKRNNRKPSENVCFKDCICEHLNDFLVIGKFDGLSYMFFSVAWSVVQGSITRPISDRSILESMRPARNAQTRIWKF